MSSTDLVLLAVAVATAAVMLSPPLLRSRDWRATVTPLASIIGSGFLVAGPILGHVAGHYAVAAMAALCAISYLFGLAVRDNISRLEPMLAAESPPPVLLWLDRAADLALILAYFVSVAYYLDLLADFALKAFGVVDPMVAHGMTTAILALLGTLGYFGGLRWLEHVELGSVGLKLAMIAALIAALAWALGSEVAAGTVAVRPLADQAEGFDAVRILLGLIILVQGFETSRYLGDSYDRATRVRTMRHAQWIAFVVYMLFIGLLTPWLDGRLPPEGGDTHVIELLRPVGSLVAPSLDRGGVGGRYLHRHRLGVQSLRSLLWHPVGDRTRRRMGRPRPDPLGPHRPARQRHRHRARRADPRPRGGRLTSRRRRSRIA